MSINQSSTELISKDEASNAHEEERDLNEDEEYYLKAFEENDKELEDIAEEVVKALNKVKLNA